MKNEKPESLGAVTHTHQIVEQNQIKIDNK